MKLDRMAPPLTTIMDRVSYDRHTGIFIALQSRGRRRVGDRVGYADAQGYWKLAFDGKWVMAHRLAWAIVHGDWPDGEIDHINGDPADNRISNLREVTRSQNMMNAKGSGRGWHWHSARGKWQALIRVDGKRKFLGYFDTEAEARTAYETARKKYHGEYSHTNRPPKKPEQTGMDL